MWRQDLRNVLFECCEEMHCQVAESLCKEERRMSRGDGTRKSSRRCTMEAQKSEHEKAGLKLNATKEAGERWGIETDLPAVGVSSETHQQ